jgi:hypothetical protein
MTDPIDPQVKSGCPQCGTYLYYKKSDDIRSKKVSTGKNKDTGALDDRKYVKCGRCGFICHTQRDSFANEGSKRGWGVTFS